MSSPADDADARGDGIGALLELARSGHPDDALPLREILGDLQDSAFGMFLLIAVIPSFIPIPGVAGAISGPLVMLIGAQMLAGLRRPWLPGPIGRRGPKRRTLARFVGAASRWLDRLDRLLKPRLASLTGAAGRHVSGLLLVLLGLLLALPIPFTNYLFGGLLLVFSLALLERDGLVLLVAWLAGIAAIAVFGVLSGGLADLASGWLHRLST